MSVTIKSFAYGLSGKIQSGDIVSVIAPDYKKQGITVIPPELKYVEVISVTASSGYDANTGDQRHAGPNSEEDERELFSTVTLLVSAEQSRVLAELESDGKLHLSLVYRGTPANTAKFIETQDKVNAELYPPAVEDAAIKKPENTASDDSEGSEDAGATAAESVSKPSAESEVQ